MELKRVLGLPEVSFIAVGFLMVLFFSAVIPVDLGSLLKVLLFLAFILSGVVYYQWRKRYLLRQEIDLGELKRQDWGVA